MDTICSSIRIGYGASGVDSSAIHSIELHYFTNCCYIVIPFTNFPIASKGNAKIGPRALPPVLAAFPIALNPFPIQFPLSSCWFPLFPICVPFVGHVHDRDVIS